MMVLAIVPIIGNVKAGTAGARGDERRALGAAPDVPPIADQACRASPP
jgi:hypothetical protein